MAKRYEDFEKEVFLLTATKANAREGFQNLKESKRMRK
jgi:hypothetical protein